MLRYDALFAVPFEGRFFAGDAALFAVRFEGTFALFAGDAYGCPSQRYSLDVSCWGRISNGAGNYPEEGLAFLKLKAGDRGQLAPTPRSRPHLGLLLRMEIRL